MRIMPVLGLLLLVPCLAGAGEPSAEVIGNWHQWRGPLANGYAPQADPPTTWDAETNVQWKVEVPGRGDGTPIVWGDRIFLLSAIKTDRELEEPLTETPEAPGGNPFKIQQPTHYYQFVVLCYDRNTGDLLWQQTATEQVPHEGHHRDHGFASASAVTDGERLIASFGSRGIYCYDLDGKLQWQRDLGQMTIYRFFGEGSTPVLHGDTLIVNWDHEGDSYLYALDAATGETRWQVARDERSSWTTPLVVEQDGVAQVVVNGGARARGYDLASGEVLWECGGQTQAVIASPVQHEGLVYCMSGYPGSAFFAIPLDARGDITDSDKIAWTRDRDAPYCPSALVYKDRLYFNKTNRAILTCLDARSGEPIIEKQRMPDLRGIYASPVAAAGKIYFTGRDGTTLVLDDGPEFKVLATNKLDDPMDASFALVGRQIIARSEQHLYSIAQ